LPESYIGRMKKITFTAFESSIVKVFDTLMPDPDIKFNEKTGITTRIYRNTNGDIFEVNS